MKVSGGLEKLREWLERDIEWGRFEDCNPEKLASRFAWLFGAVADWAREQEQDEYMERDKRDSQSNC